MIDDNYDAYRIKFQLNFREKYEPEPGFELGPPDFQPGTLTLLSWFSNSRAPGQRSGGLSSNPGLGSDFSLEI